MRADLCADAELAGFYPVSSGTLSDALFDTAASFSANVMLHFDSIAATECGALLDFDARLESSRSRVLVSVAPAALDDVFACIDRSQPEILVAPSRGERLVALGLLMAMESPGRVREGIEADNDALRLLTEQVAQIAAQLDRLSAGPSAFRLESPADAFRGEGEESERKLIRKPRPPLPDPRLVRMVIRQRQARARFFDVSLFADPAWDMLLDLTAARAEHARVSVTSLCIASGVPPTTALRWINQMVDAGLLERVEDEADRRRAFIQLSDNAADAMARYFAELGKDARSLV